LQETERESKRLKEIDKENIGKKEEKTGKYKISRNKKVRRKKRERRKK
jgi:hypothetical protein